MCVYLSVCLCLSVPVSVCVRLCLTVSDSVCLPVPVCACVRLCLSVSVCLVKLHVATSCAEAVLSVKERCRAVQLSPPGRQVEPTNAKKKVNKINGLFG